MRGSVLRALTLVPLYAVLVGWLTWPLATHLTTHHPRLGVGRDFDSLYSAWVLSWESHALASPGVRVGSANIYYPEPDSLYYGPAAFGALPFFAPVYLLTGNPALALNLLLLGCITLTAAMVHFVVHLWTRLHTAGLVAAVALLANRWLLLSFVPGVPHISVLFYFPLIILLSSSRSLTWPRTVLLGLLVVAQGMTDVMYIAPSVLIPLTVLMVLALARHRTRWRALRLLLIIAVAGIVLIAVHAPYLSVAQRNPELLKQTLWNLDPFNISIALPSGLMGLVSPLAVASLVPVLILTGGVLAALRWRGTPREASAWRYCTLWAATGIAISLPGHVTVLGHLYALPRLQFVRFSPALGRLLTHTERLRVPALMGCALLAGLAFAEILRQCNLSNAGGKAKRWPGAALAVLLCVVMYVQYQSAIGQPLAYGPPLGSAYPGGEAPRDSPVLRELRRLGGPTVEVPLPRAVDPEGNATAMYRSIFHWQPLLNGYGSFWPARFPALMRIAAALPRPDAVRNLRRQTGLSFILVRKQAEPGVKDGQAAQREEWMKLAQRGGRGDLELVAEDDELLLFHVTE